MNIMNITLGQLLTSVRMKGCWKVICWESEDNLTVLFEDSEINREIIKRYAKRQVASITANSVNGYRPETIIEVYEEKEKSHESM